MSCTIKAGSNLVQNMFAGTATLACKHFARGIHLL